jgi:hypothetical protein
MNEEKLLADSLETYIRDKHTQEECIGFIDGFKEALRQFAVIKSVCDHDKIEVEADHMGNTHYCKKCGLWNF